ncbi:DNA polymerase III subunit delta [Mangrovimicrobium sediminis]|uniref:DNA polymerase III subunit delta n=1 Tax=Mangrovimicrobium sediminis TaxID=2562682 RepID=A0A4Z0M4A9_9GAMM|nr:DNA polymerase III subunit delta [Haliea sp. SAOS-164]TGD74296.1 DNA polymerase III subunit delta [Haliea sp. SAOS-164]
MRLYPEKLPGQLKQQLLPVYLVSGDEPLLVQECCDAVRAAARADGCSERELIEADAPGFSWDALVGSAASMSLFGERKLVELRIPSGKPGAEGSKALLEYLALGADSGDILLVVAGKIDKQSTNSKWYKALDTAGATVQVWPVKPAEMPRWMQQRLAAAGLEIDRDALEMLCDRVEGNLLAAVQEVEKLKLLAGEGRISAATVAASVAHNARYNLFDMADQALAGNAADSLKMLHGLRGEGTEPSVALWALLREIRTLQQASTAVDAGQRPQQALTALRVWNNRMGLMQGALGRHSRASLGRLLESAATVDGSIKGFAAGNPWDNLDRLVLALAGRG